MFNRFERYLDWAKIYNFRKFYILYQYGHQNSKYPTMSKKNLQKSCYNSGIMWQISMSNSLSYLVGTYFDWTEIVVEKNFMFCTNMAARIQNVRISTKILNIEITQRQNSVCNSSFEKVIHKDRNNVCKYSYNMNVICVLNMAGKLNLEMMRKSTKSCQNSFFTNTFIYQEPK